MRVARDCTVIGPENVHFGDDVRVDSGTAIIATQGTLTLEGCNHIGGHNHLAVVTDLSFGIYSGTSQGVRIYTASDDLSGRQSARLKKAADLPGVTIRPVEIARFVGIGASAVVLPGCHIREGSVVGALSLVNRALRPWGVYHGNPVRRISDRPRDLCDVIHAVRVRLGAE
ncbi:acyltransferase [Sphingomonas sp.]|uniref:acyltransferase n=1 Tax=Sphingomonas sp. TaxID=28214 RepID=UPI0035BC4ACE